MLIHSFWPSAQGDEARGGRGAVPVSPSQKALGATDREGLSLLPLWEP